MKNKIQKSVIQTNVKNILLAAMPIIYVDDKFIKPFENT